ncbi:MAG: hypothetical protein J6Q22_15170 [Prevotella sp.]|nr:hypothetical protein [Prevotella sp.]
MATNYSEQLRLADIYAFENSWDDDEWKKVYNWLKENQREIDKKTVRSLCKSLDEAEDIIWTLGLS